MKNLAMMIFLTILTISCSGKVSAKSVYGLSCENVGPSITRCSNKEVICYVRNNGGVFCKFKVQKPTNAKYIGSVDL